MRSRYYTNAGKLKPYAFACGYVEQDTRADGAQVTLGMVDGVYSVGYWQQDARCHTRYFRTLTAARAYYRRCLRPEVTP